MNNLIELDVDIMASMGLCSGSDFGCHGGDVLAVCCLFSVWGSEVGVIGVTIYLELE